MRALVASVAVLLPLSGWAALTIHSGPATPVAGGRAGATSAGGATLVDEEPPAPPPAVTVAPLSTSTTVSSVSSTTRPAPATTTTTRVPRPPRPATTTTTVDLPAFMKTTPNPPGYLAAATSWEAKGDGITVRMRIDPASPVDGQPVRFLIDYTGGDTCCIVELHFGDGSPHFLANHDPPCVKGGTLSPGPHSTVVTHIYDEPGPYRVLVKILDGDLCTLPPVPVPGAPVPLHHLEMFACVAVGPDTPFTPGCDPLPPYGPYFPQ